MSTSPPNTASRTAVALAGLVFGLTAPMAYVIERIYERLRGGKHIPTLIVAEAHAGFYWRAIIAAWWAGFVALVAARLVRNRPEAWPRLIDRALYAALVLIPVLGWLTYRYP
jgi:hypothetical protein